MSSTWVYAVSSPIMIKIKLLVPAALLCLFSPLGAQQADTNVAQVSFAAGGLFGLGGHGSYGANLAAPVTRHLAPFIDFSYSPLSSYAFTYGLENAGKGLFTSSL